MNKHKLIGGSLVVVLGFSQLGMIGAFAQERKSHWLFAHHPKLRRITKAAGFGVVTGGLAAPLLGASAASGAMIGATEHATVRGVKDRHDEKHRKHLDTRIW